MTNTTTYTDSDVPQMPPDEEHERALRHVQEKSALTDRYLSVARARYKLLQRDE